MITDAKTIPAGYKQTEIGVIPEDWDLVSLGKLCNYQNGTALEKYFNNASGLKVISIGNYSETGKFVQTGSYIDRRYTKDLKKFVLNKNDLTMILNDKTAVGTIIGRVLYIEENDKYIFNQRTMRLTTKDNTDPLFLYFQINGGKTHKYIVNLSKPGTQIYVNTNDITELPIATPKSKPEQTAIATALSDTDALIEKMEKLIAKKKAIKQGAMQQLLTGKKRLPGFSGEWEVKKLGEVASISTGKKDVNEGSVSGLYPFFTCSKKISHSNSYSFEGEAILIAGNGEVGHLQYYNGKFEAYQRTYVLQNFSVDVDYLWLQLSANFKKSLGIGTIGSTIPYIKKENIFDFEYSCPKDLEEQTAIATVLSDMDAEIEKLENKLGKYRQIKTGMMQQLLTGKIRLVKN